MSALVTKFSENNSETFQITVIFMFATLGYFLSMAMGFSCVIGIIATGLTQMRYAIPNLSPQNQMTTKRIAQITASFTEMLIFVVLGSEANTIDIKSAAIFTSIVFVSIVIVRLVVTFGLIALLNHFRNIPVSLNKKFIIFMGGLRGAFAFVMILSYNGPFRALFHDTILLIIILTNTINGIATKPIVEYMQLQEKDRGQEETFVNILNYITKIAKHSINTLSSEQDTHQALTMKFLNFEREYLYKFLSKNTSGQERIFRDFDEYEQGEALKLVKSHSIVSLLKTSMLAERMEAPMNYEEFQEEEEYMDDNGSSEMSIDEQFDGNKNKENV